MIIDISPSKAKFKFGNCGAVAISEAFDVPYSSVQRLFKGIRCNCKDGCTYAQIRRIISLLSKAYNKPLKYIKQRDISLEQFLMAHKTGNYIIMTEMHVLYYSNRVLWDTYVYNYIFGPPRITGYRNGKFIYNRGTNILKKFRFKGAWQLF